MIYLQLLSLCISQLFNFYWNIWKGNIANCFSRSRQPNWTFISTKSNSINSQISYLFRFLLTEKTMFTEWFVICGTSSAHNLKPDTNDDYKQKTISIYTLNSKSLSNNISYDFCIFRRINKWQPTKKSSKAPLKNPRTSPKLAKQNKCHNQIAF